MKKIILILTSSVGKKIAMAVTGLFLSIFLIEHLYGNLLLYKVNGIEAFDEYSHSLVHNMLIRIVEVVLFVAILYHIIQATTLTLQNNSARPVDYSVKKDSENSNWFSRNMYITGSVIFFFLVVHLYTFFVPYRITAETNSPGQLVVDAFSNVYYSSFYVLATMILAFHLNHGFQSGFQTLGLNNKKCAPALKTIGTCFSILIFIGFASFPIIFFFNLL